MNFGLGDIPIVGDIYKSLRGDPDAVKAAYDKQIQASKDQAAQMQQFLMGREAIAQRKYAPLEHMFGAAYGTEGLHSAQVPQAPGTPLAAMYGGR